MREADQTTRGRSSGFTLIETLVAVVILSVGLVVVLEAMNAAVGGMKEARDALVADSFTRAKLAEAVFDAETMGAAALAEHEGAFSLEGGLVAEVTVEAFGESAPPSVKLEHAGGLYRVGIHVWHPRQGSRFSTATLVYAAEESP